MKLRCLTIKAANRLVRCLHRHHDESFGMFAVGCELNGRLCGAAIIAKPKARMIDRINRTSVLVAEIVRVVTDGTPNACSFLYGACKRILRVLGVVRAITYTLPHEGGASLRASGFRMVAKTRGGTWSRGKRPRTDKAPTCPKWRWEAAL